MLIHSFINSFFIVQVSCYIEYNQIQREHMLVFFLFASWIFSFWPTYPCMARTCSLIRFHSDEFHAWLSWHFLIESICTSIFELIFKKIGLFEIKPSPWLVFIVLEDRLKVIQMVLQHSTTSRIYPPVRDSMIISLFFVMF